MPDTRSHRGAHPEDGTLFAPDLEGTLQAAVSDLCWLYGRGYSTKASVSLVGDRYQLRARQRVAIQRASCSDASLQIRRAREVAGERLHGSVLLIDGYNVLTTIEAALAGGILLRCRDGCIRDMASMHGTYHSVEETVPALEMIAAELASLGIREARWLLDRPVSNSGTLRLTMQAVAERLNQRWSVDLVPDPDAVLAAAAEPVATSDSQVLERCGRWFNLAGAVLLRRVPEARIIELHPGG